MKTLRKVGRFARKGGALLGAGGVLVVGMGRAAHAQVGGAGAAAVTSVFTASDLTNTANALITGAGGPAVVIMACVAAFGAAWGLAGKARRIGR